MRRGRSPQLGCCIVRAHTSNVHSELRARPSHMPSVATWSAKPRSNFSPSQGALRAPERRAEKSRVEETAKTSKLVTLGNISYHR